MARADRIGNALARGRVLAAQVRRLSPGSWSVPSQSSDGQYVVRVIDHRLACSCRAAEAGQPCAHVAATALWLAGLVDQAPVVAVAAPRRAA